MANTRELSQLASVISVADETRNIGIGTTTPTSKLHVSGDVRVSGVVTATSFSGDGSALTGLSVGVGTTASINTTGIITAASFNGDGSALTGVSASKWVTTAAGIHTLSNVGIGTTSKSTYKLFVDGDARVTGILSIGQGTVTIDGSNNTITASNFIGDLSQIFPTGDYGDLSTGINDAFEQLISSATLYDFLDTPSGSIQIEDFGVLT
jgi:hypothetical protein